MRSTPSVPGARILGLGEHRPARAVSNDEIAARIGVSDEWIRERTGIVSRRFAGPDETVVDMAVEASAKALADSGVTGDQVDLVLVATCTHPYHTPGTAGMVATRIGASGVGAMDLSAACAGFCYALSVAADAIRAGTARYVVVVGSDKFTDFLDHTDRSTSFIFGDGAGAVVLGPAEEAGIGPVAWGSDGEGAGLVTQSRSWVAAREDPAGGWPVLVMDGPTVFRWAVTQLAPVARRACDLAGVDPGELVAFVPHQANLRIVEALAKSLRIADKVIARDIVDTGNTSAASIPLALGTLRRRGEVKSGDLALLFGFGAGLCYAGQVVRCP